MARARGIALLVVLVASLGTVLNGHSPATSTASARADVTRGRPGSVFSHQAIPVSPGTRRDGSQSCPMTVRSSGYADPVAGARVRAERIDQGVDYAGSGALAAIGAARMTQVAASGTGWPGAFIEYRLLTGADAGCYVYYAEGVSPIQGLRVGDTVSAGQVVATIVPHYPTGFEIGWGGGIGTKTYVGITGQWSATDDLDNVASDPGKAFSALVSALGGPAGRVEG